MPSRTSALLRHTGHSDERGGPDNLADTACVGATSVARALPGTPIGLHRERPSRTGALLRHSGDPTMRDRPTISLTPLGRSDLGREGFTGNAHRAQGRSYGIPATRPRDRPTISLTPLGRSDLGCEGFTGNAHGLHRECPRAQGRSYALTGAPRLGAGTACRPATEYRSPVVECQNPASETRHRSQPPIDCNALAVFRRSNRSTFDVQPTSGAARKASPPHRRSGKTSINPAT
ncbi:hypothetical protein FHY25_000908 [Xanthomonas arboricola]|nr:hypothetical protein [Xanthomonas campestris]MCW2006327.1 hypothetical protein [Xanthomonas campestris]